MTKSEFELHPDRLSTTDAKGRRIYVYPADVRGFFRRHRTQVQVVLIVFFLTLPWIEIHGRQALLFDITERRFEIFGLSLRAHNAPLLILVLASAAFGLFFATAIFGRIWCGWSCPQTVFIDGVFRRIERWTEGSAFNRRKRDLGPWTFDKIWRRNAKWTLSLVAALIVTHSFLAYFVGTEHLSEMIRRSPSENWGSFVFMLAATALVVFDFVWFREQFCTIVCPYGRFQSVLMDKNSLVVAYDVKRGEPRATPESKVIAKQDGSKLGDCVNCYRCVQVCPTGIDIRRGLQMECIACTSCIDACDEVMTKLKKETGLIRYNKLVPTRKRRRLNFRAGLYLTLCLLSIAALLFGLASIRPVDVQILRAKDTPYTVQTEADGVVVVINHFRVELSNQSGGTHDLDFSVPRNLSDAGVQIITAFRPLPLADGKVTQTDVFIRFPRTLLSNGQKLIPFLIHDTSQATEKTLDIMKEVTLVGPFT